VTTDGNPGITVRHDDQRRLYEAVVDDRVVGYLVYEVAGQTVSLTHTVVEPQMRGRGVGSALARFALDDLRERRQRPTVLCSFVTDFVARNPEYRGLIDHVIDTRPGRFGRTQWTMEDDNER